MNTIKLYEQDAYQTTFKARVLSCEEVRLNEKIVNKEITNNEITNKRITNKEIANEEIANKVYQVVLDQTSFFPEEGGQSPDRGTMRESGQDAGLVRVLNVQIRKDVIVHTVLGKLEVGQEVWGDVDWKHRFYNMQQHSGEHIFSGLVHSTFGYDNVGFHLSDSGVTMDFNGAMTEEQILQIEGQANEAITKNIEVLVTYPGKAELMEMDYRSKIAIEGQTRIVTIPGYDRCACCAPHVQRTGEIGMLKVVNTQNYKGGVRVSILCGFRALADYQEKLTQVSRISALLSAKPELTADAVEKMKSELTAVKQQLIGAKQSLIIQKIQQMTDSERNVCMFEQDMEAMVMRVAVNTMMETHGGYCGIFVGNDETGYHYIVGTKDGDARELGNLLRERFQAKGGGKPEMIQGSMQASEKDIREVFRSFV
ncbi:MAG: alanine--tRNA ligase-related protein [Lachnospiraceae bacterium]|nr:alanine--tRNA ligase-related protein [Lachnospiraceae bacterium]